MLLYCHAAGPVPRQLKESLNNESHHISSERLRGVSSSPTFCFRPELTSFQFRSKPGHNPDSNHDLSRLNLHAASTRRPLRDCHRNRHENSRRSDCHQLQHRDVRQVCNRNLRADRNRHRHRHNYANHDCSMCSGESLSHAHFNRHSV